MPTALHILKATVHTPLLSIQNVCKAVEETQHPPTLQEIKQKIDSYNSREKHCLGMKLVSRALSTPTRHPSCPTPTCLPGCRVLCLCMKVVGKPVPLSSILLCPSPQKQ